MKHSKQLEEARAGSQAAVKELEQVYFTIADNVKSDAQFQSISIGRETGSGGCIKVWAVSKDGVAYLRHGVSDLLPTGWMNTRI